MYRYLTRFALTLAILFSCVQLMAQSSTIKGKVVDAINNEGIPFASVAIEGTAIGTSTDFEGNFYPRKCRTWDLQHIHLLCGIQQKDNLRL